VRVSYWSGVSESEDCCGAVVVGCWCYKLVAEAREQFGIPEEGQFRRWKPLPSNGYGRLRSLISNRVYIYL
jgi:hypothetical protein